MARTLFLSLADAAGDILLRLRLRPRLAGVAVVVPRLDAAASAFAVAAILGSSAASAANVSGFDFGMSHIFTQLNGRSYFQSPLLAPERPRRMSLWPRRR